MSNTPVVTYTAEEQKNLTAITNNERIFKNIHELLQKGQFPGSFASTVLESFMALENILRQTEAQKQAIQKGAEERVVSESNEAAKEAPVAKKKEAKAAGNA